MDCPDFLVPPEIFPNIRLRPPVVIAAPDAAVARRFSRTARGGLPRRGVWVQAN